MATVKVSEQTYKRLNELAGRLRSRLGRPVSVDEVLDLALREKKPRPADFAGTWLMTDEEEKEIERGLKRSWRRWKPRE